MRKPLLIAAALLAATTSTALADKDECTVEPKLVSYYKPKKLPKKADDRCDPKKDGTCKKLELKGYLYVPPAEVGEGPFPVIVYNHGSGQKVKDYCEFGSYFARLGYVVFMPQRRGHGDSTGVF